MKTALIKDGIKEVKNSYKRFLSLLLIVLLGVGFFAGIKAASPDMKNTLDTYFDDLNVMDIQVISTMGLTDNDITAIKNIENINEVEGTYQSDAVVNIGNEQVVVKLETMTKDINSLKLIEGKLPENENECVVEKRFLSETDHKIGDKVKVDIEDITNEQGEKQKVLKNDELTIVGVVETPMYISTDRGNTKLGSGMIDFYMYISKDNINVDMYTNIYVTVAGAKELDTTSDKYAETVDSVIDSLEEIADERQEARYNEFYDAANSKIEDAQKKLDEEKSKAEKELADAEKKLKDAQAEIDSGEKELETNRANANKQFAEAEEELEKGKEELSQKEKEFEESKKKVYSQISEYEEQLETLEDTKKQLDTANSSLEQLNESIKTVENELEQVTTEAEKQVLQAKLEELNTQKKTLEEAITTIQEELKKQGITDISTTITTIEKGIETAKNELSSGEQQIKEAKEKIEESEQTLKTTKNTTYSKLNQVEAELEDAQKEVDDGKKELEDSRKEFEKKIKEAEDELLDAKEELKRIERPEWYVLDREQNSGYVSYVQDTDRIAKIAEVFPVVFFLVAALMSLNSMSRMVEEERVQIGTLKALGYNKLQISMKYLLYAFFATVIGGQIGLLIGFNWLPKIIADMYAMVYDLPDVILEYNMQYATIGMVFAMLCTVGATIYTCIKELIHNPATLMRPKAPKPGKRVILEKIPFIWKHLNFTAKVTARNLFRYKKRFLMTIIGVCGCTSLIIAGFGIRDAISNMIPMQYGEIYKYNISISLKEEKDIEEIEELENKILENEDITEVLGANIQSVKIIKDDNNQSIQLIIPENVNKLENFISLRDRKNNEEKYVLDNSGVIITEKLAKILDLSVGDTINLENADGDRADVKVAHITENYLMHYIYITPELYNTIYDTKIESNVILAKTNNITKAQEDDLGKTILQDKDNITGVEFTSATKNIFSTVMDNMNVVVWILIVSAGLLALVVLYNLLNANISERIRELATIKVLGFYDKEVYSYIGRETIILTILGILLGLVGGYFLTIFILKTCELDMLMFDSKIQILTYVLGVVITIFFATIVNIVTYFSLKKIDMIESLKSVE